MPVQVIGGRYRLLSEIATGGFGTVWRAHDERLRVEVAVKQLRLDPTASDAEREKAIARAEREARHAAKLRDHPNIVAVHDVVVEAGMPWLVMRLVRGRSLADELEQRGRLPPKEAARIAADVLTALEAAHALGIVHRDVKPANIMLADDGTVLLTDFGIAKHATDTIQTTRGVVIGSLPYMSPERLNGEDLPAGDLFALGATLYEMVEGASPFARTTPTAIMSAVALEEPKAPEHAGPLRDAILELLRKDAAKRPDARTARARVVIQADEKGQSKEPLKPSGNSSSNGDDHVGWTTIAALMYLVAMTQSMVREQTVSELSALLRTDQTFPWKSFSELSSGVTLEAYTLCSVLVAGLGLCIIVVGFLPSMLRRGGSIASAGEVLSIACWCFLAAVAILALSLATQDSQPDSSGSIHITPLDGAWLDFAAAGVLALALQAADKQKAVLGVGGNKS